MSATPAPGVDAPSDGARRDQAPSLRRRTPWRWRQSVGEGMRNVVAAPFLFGVMIVATAILAGGSAVADQAVVAGILRDESAFLAAGGDILHAEAQNGQIDAAACAAVGELPGVEAVAGTSQRVARIVGRPDYTQTVLVATPGIERVLGVEPLGTGEVLVAAQVAERWSWTEGVLLALEADPTYEKAWTPPTGTVRVAATVDLSRLGDVATTAVVVVESLETVEECVVRAAPNEVDAVAQALPALLGETSGHAVDVRRQQSAGEFGPDAAGDFAARPTRWTGGVAGGVVGLLIAFVQWSRRQRSALYATVGITWAHGVAIRVTECAFAVVAGALWGVLLATATGIVLGLDPAVSLGVAWRHAAACAGVALAVALLVSLWRAPVLAALKDR